MSNAEDRVINYLVSKIQESDGETTEDDGEMKPGEERSFVRKGHLWFHTHGQGDPFRRRALE